MTAVTQFVCPTSSDTIRAGHRLGEKLRPGDVVLVSGALGSGKTTFIQGLVRGYGVDTVVTSPTFALIHVYSTGDRTVVHADPYRLEGAAEIATIGLEEYLDTDAVVAIEWPERLGDLISGSAIRVAIVAGPDEARRIHVVLPDRRQLGAG